MTTVIILYMIIIITVISILYDSDYDDRLQWILCCCFLAILAQLVVEYWLFVLGLLSSLMVIIIMNIAGRISIPWPPNIHPFRCCYSLLLAVIPWLWPCSKMFRNVEKCSGNALRIFAGAVFGGSLAFLASTYVRICCSSATVFSYGIVIRQLPTLPKRISFRLKSRVESLLHTSINS